MMENVNGLSLDLLIHPGKTLKELLEERNMTQEELAIRTLYSPKHISEVVRGKKDISSEFASRLEYALSIPASFWMNLQGNYDKEIFKINSIASISKEELAILNELKEVIRFCEDKNIIECNSKKEITVLNMRKFLNINNLCSISDLPLGKIAFRGSKKNKVNIYVLYAWQKICEYIASENILKNSYDEDVLISKLCDIKSTMFLPLEEMINRLKQIFSECGITFLVVKQFRGAPVQGFIKKKNNTFILCMTTRQSYSDIFWFTLFHEIGHILNDNLNDKYIDYQFIENEEEDSADYFSRNILIDEDDYKSFLTKNDLTIKSIEAFAESQGVNPSIVIGRIQRDKNDYSFMSKYREKYIW